MIPKRHGKPWEPHEIDYLEHHYGVETHAQMGDALGRSEKAVRNKCWRLGLVRDCSWTDKELQRLHEVYEQAGETGPVNLRWLELAFGRKRSNICHKARQLGLNTTSRRMTGEWFRNETSNRISQYWQEEGLPQPKWTHVKGGKRDDIRGGMYFRSAWEANYARYLSFLVALSEIADWEYESDHFEFSAIKRGHRSYTPDFKIINLDGSIEYHEVKGWLDPASKVKLKRMAKYYPEIQIIIIDKDAYQAIQKECKNLVPGWE